MAVVFDSNSAKRIGAATRQVEAWQNGGGNKPRGARPAGSGSRFLARITGSASLGTNRWKYAWTEVVIDDDGVATVANGRSGTTSSDYAFNLAEVNHTSQYAWGVDMNADDYPAGFGPRPVGGGGSDDTHKTDEVVEMTQCLDAIGNKKFYFRATGSHDGGCSA